MTTSCHIHVKDDRRENNKHSGGSMDSMESCVNPCGVSTHTHTLDPHPRFYGSIFEACLAIRAVLPWHITSCRSSSQTCIETLSSFPTCSHSTLHNFHTGPGPLRSTSFLFDPLVTVDLYFLSLLSSAIIPSSCLVRRDPRSVLP